MHKGCVVVVKGELRTFTDKSVKICSSDITFRHRTSEVKTLENILFEYPVREENGSLDEEFQVLKKQLTKLKYAVMISSFCALTMYFLSAFFAKAELIFYFLTALFVFVAMHNRQDFCAVS